MKKNVRRILSQPLSGQFTTLIGTHNFLKPISLLTGSGSDFIKNINSPRIGQMTLTL